MKCENWPGEFGINGLVFQRNRAFGNRSSRIVCIGVRWNLLEQVGGFELDGYRKRGYPYFKWA